MNAKAVKDLLENDGSVNLREALRGPVDLQDPDTSLWNYEFLRGNLTLPFQHLGIALLCDREPNDKQSLSILNSILKQPSFVPEPVDFESIVRVCRGSGRVMMLKNFLSTFSVQFIFSSYPYESQRRITRLLLGLFAEGN